MSGKVSQREIFFPIISAVFAITCIAVAVTVTTAGNDFYIKEINMETAESGFVPETEGIPTADRININTANSDELVQLPGIGEVIAERIIAYREEYGEFANIREITAVQGIGDGIFDNIKDLITV